MSDKEKSEGVSIGNVTGGIYGSIIAGRDVKNATINLGNKQVPADKEPSFEEFQQLLGEIKKELAELAAQEEILNAVSPAAPSLVQGAAASVESVADATQDNPEMEPEEAKTVEQRLTEATRLLGTILDSTKSVAGKAMEAGRTIAPVIEKLGPLAEKIGVAAFWAAKIWLS
jgi:ABC-type transporter Mla subunit MlaD